MDISRHPLLDQSYRLSLAIEACGASTALTNAVSKSSDLGKAIDKLLDQMDAERDENALRRERITNLLNGIARALLGPPPELTLHDWSKLPEHATAAAEANARLQLWVTQADRRGDEALARARAAETKLEVARAALSKIHSITGGESHEYRTVALEAMVVLEKMPATADDPKHAALRAENEQLRAEIQKLKDMDTRRERVMVTMGDVQANHIIAMQSAVIDTVLCGAAFGMRWISNTLRGPGLLPSIEDAKAIGGAQAWFDQETAKHEEFRKLHPGPAAPVEPESRRLRTALDHIARVALGSTSRSRRNVWVAARAVSALNNDEVWKDTPKPRNYHDALERDVTKEGLGPADVVSLRMEGVPA